MMSCSTSGAPIPMRSKNSGTRVFLPEASTTNSAGTISGCRTVVTANGDADDGVAVAIEHQVGDLGLVAEVDPRFVVQPAPHAPFQQRPTGTDDLDVARAGLLPTAPQADSVLGCHVDLERALAHHVVHDAGEEALQLDLTRGEQVMEVPALCGTRPALAAAVRVVLLEHDDALEGFTAHLGRRDTRDAAADDHRRTAAAAANLGDVQTCVVEASRVTATRRPTGDELLVVQPDAMEAVVFQPGSGGFDHRSWAAEVDVGVAAGQHPLFQQVGDESCCAHPIRHPDARR